MKFQEHILAWIFGLIINFIKVLIVWLIFQKILRNNLFFLIFKITNLHIRYVFVIIVSSCLFCIIDKKEIFLKDFFVVFS